MSAFNIFKSKFSSSSSSSSTTDNTENTPNTSNQMDVDEPKATKPTLPPGTPSVGLSASAQLENVCFNKDHEMYIRANLNAMAVEMDDSRKPMDIVVVLDHSGSMSGSKMDLCKKTCKFLTKELNEKDRLSCVIFDSEVDTLFPLTPMNKAGKKKVTPLISKIQANSATNLSGGLFEGISVMRNGLESSETHVRAIMLLTDGFMNNGVTNEQTLSTMTAKLLAEIPNVNLFTFGYGASHSVDLLKTLADVGHGQYFFVSDVEAIASAFGDCLGGLVSITAQNVKLTCTPLGGAEILGEPCTRYNATRLGGGKFEISIPDMYADEEKDILFKVKLPKLTAPVMEVDAPVARFDVQYVDLVNETTQLMTSELCVSRKDTEESETNQEVVKQMNRWELTQELERAKEMSNAGDVENGRKVLFTYQEKMRIRSAMDEDYNAKLDKELDDNIASMQSTSQWQMKGRYLAESSLCGHYQQRSNTGEEASLYRKKGGAKSAMMSKMQSFVKK